MSRDNNAGHSRKSPVDNINRRNINFQPRFADDINLLDGSESELQGLTYSLEKWLHHLVWN